MIVSSEADKTLIPPDFSLSQHEVKCLLYINDDPSDDTYRQYGMMYGHAKMLIRKFG